MTTADIQQLQYAFSKAQERNEELAALLKASNASNDALVEMVLKHEATIKTLTAERDELNERAQFVAGWNEITVGLGETVKEMKAHIDDLTAERDKLQVYYTRIELAHAIYADQCREVGAPNLSLDEWLPAFMAQVADENEWRDSWNAIPWMALRSVFQAADNDGYYNDDVAEWLIENGVTP